MDTLQKASNQRIWKRAINSAVAWNFAATFLRAGAAVLILPLLLRKLPTDHLGLWYVFLSLGMMAGLLDMGLSVTVSRSVAYLWAGATKLSAFGFVTVDAPQQQLDQPPNYRLLANLIQTMRHYYRLIASLAFLVLLGIGGGWVWIKTQGMAEAPYLRTLWIIYAVGSTASITGSFWTALLTGINHIRQSQQILTISLLLNYLISVSGLLLGWGLLSLVFGNMVMGICLRIFGEIVFRRMTRETIQFTKEQRDFSLIKILWPNAWRTGVNTIGLYLTLFASTLVCSGALGLKVTASYGLSLQVTLLIVQISSAAFLMKLPFLSQLRTRSDTASILAIAVPRFWIFILLYITGGTLLLFCGPFILQEVLHTKTMLLPTDVLLSMLIIVGLEGHHGLYRELAMTSNQNPFVKPILISGVAIIALTVFLVPYLGVWGLVGAHGLVQLSYNNWWVVLKGIHSLGLKGREYWRYFCRSGLAAGRPDMARQQK
jgi:O-antigen/teichoic acid export membrane protein